MRSFNKQRLFGSTLLVSLAATAFAAPAMAQDTTEEAIVVTGSRIARQNFDAPTAVVTVGAERINATGATEIGDVLRVLPQIGASGLTPTSAAALSTTGFGLSTVQLRNLGEDRTLVLVNGRRFVSGLPGTQQVDMNAIPAEMIERIDVVTGGASAIYGSDALAGVVNIILDDKFEGFRVSGRAGISSEKDQENFKLTATGGGDFANGRGHAMASLSWSKENGAWARDHGNAIDTFNEMINFTGDPKDIGVSHGPFFSSYALGGYFTIPGSGEEGDGAPLTVRNGVGGTVVPFESGVDGFNRNFYRRLVTPIERYNFNAVLDYDINSAVKWFLEGNYNSTRAETGGEPFPLDSSNIYGDGTPNYLAQCGDFGTGLECRYGIPLTNPLIPADIAAAVRAANPDITDDADLVVGFRRRTGELDNRIGSALRQTFRISTGFEGDLGFANYQTSLTYGRTTSQEENTGQINILNARFALDAIPNPDVPGTLMCRDVIARSQGCVPLNLFGVGSITPEMRKYVEAPGSRSGTIEEVVLNGYLNGDIEALTLPGGPVGWVLGAEYREEKSADVPDGLTQQGLNASNKTEPTYGSFQVKEIFGELRLPLLADAAFAKSLDLNLAARFSDYSTVGTTNSYSASLEWEPVDWLKLRGQYARAVRAPNIFELFSGVQQDFPSVSDPCRGVTVSGGQAAFFNVRDMDDTQDPNVVLASGVNAATIGNAVATACLSDPFVAARVARDGGLAVSQPELQGVQGLDTGNRELNEETADTFTAGFILRPPGNKWIDPLTISVDYYNIKIKDAINTIDEQVELNKCYVAGMPVQFCGTPDAPVIQRIAAGPFVGSLLNVNQKPYNTSELRAEGIDVQVTYTLETTDLSGSDWGSFQFGVYYSYLINREDQVFGETIDYTGLVGSPKHRTMATVDYALGPFSLAWQANIIGGAKFDHDPLSPVYGAEVGTEWFHSAQARWDVTDTARLEFGIDNVFDNYVHVGGNAGEVPVPVTQNSAVGVDTLPEVFDSLGRRFYVGFTLKY